LNNEQRINIKLWHPVSERQKGQKGYGLANTYCTEDIRAIQSLSNYATGQGDAPGPAQVLRALDWILNKACLKDEDFFEPGEHDTQAYVQGRKAVARAIIKLMNLKPSIFEKKDSPHEQG